MSVIVNEEQPENTIIVWIGLAWRFFFKAYRRPFLGVEDVLHVS